MNKAFEKIINRFKQLQGCDSLANMFISDAIKVIKSIEKEYNDGWISCSEKFPDNESYILLSFDNFSVPCVGRYKQDESGGAFYIGDDDETCISQELYVNAWQPLPEPFTEKKQ